MKYHFFYKK